MKEVNEVLSAIVLLQRVIPRLHGNTRETIKRNHLIQIKGTITIAIKTLKDYCTEPLVLTPIMEVINLIDTITADETFVETDNETKQLMVSRLESALHQLYLFAGKFYMTHEFTWSISKFDILKEIVDANMNAGYYFEYDKQLQAEGLI